MASTSRLKQYFLMFSTAISRVLGIVRMMVVSSVFGGGATADVINFAFNIPNNMRKLLAEGSFSKAFVPMLSRELAQLEPVGADGATSEEGVAPADMATPRAYSEASVAAGDAQCKGSDTQSTTLNHSARELMRELLGLQLIILFILVGGAIIWAPQLISLMSSFEGQQYKEAVLFFRLIIGYIICIALVASMKGAMQAVEEYRAIGINPILFSLAMIPCILFLHKSMGIYAMAIGIIAGGLLQVFGMLYPFIKAGYSLLPSFHIGSSRMSDFMRSWGRISIASFMLLVNQQIAYTLATPLEEGSVTALANAIVLWQLPYGIFVVSIITVIFPRLSKETPEIRQHTLARAVQNCMFYMFPAALILYFGGRELISVVLQHGAYTPAQANLTARVLRAYAIGMVPYVLYQLVSDFFIATKREHISLWATLLLVLSDLLLSLVLRETALRVSGLAWAHSISVTLVLVFLCSLLIKEVEWSLRKDFIASFIKRVLSVLPLFAVLLVYHYLTPAWWLGSMPMRIVILSLCGVGSLALVYISYRIAPLVELND